MIEGLRLAPWFYEAQRREACAVPSTCSACMQTFSSSKRQALGCAYERAVPWATPWTPVAMNASYRGTMPTVCPGYTTNLPEVVEAVRARVHWSKGSLTTFTKGEPPSDALIYAIEIVEGGFNEVQAWVAKPSKDGGGGA